MIRQCTKCGFKFKFKNSPAEQTKHREICVFANETHKDRVLDFLRRHKAGAEAHITSKGRFGKRG